MAKPPTPGAPGRPCSVLVLQGGGALGAYHIGAYRALAEHGLEPDWLSGISIGAINAAILAGNPPEQRLGRLEAFWHEISWPEILQPPRLLPLQILRNRLSNAGALLFGQPNFFRPRPLNPYLVPPASPAEASFYDTTPLRDTLGRFVDFALINAGGVRLTLGATDVETGRLVFFDSARTNRTIGPEHVVASGSLPPGFPATEVDGRYYWDGGCVSNTPLEAVLDDQPPGHTVVFMVDLWDAAGKPPVTMDEVQWRAKQIQYASRAWMQIDAAAAKANQRHAARMATAAVEAGGDAAAAMAAAPAQRLDIVHVIYSPTEDQIPNSDAEFSRSSIEKRQAAGYADMTRALAARPWVRAARPAGLGCMVHCFVGGKGVSADAMRCHDPVNPAV